MWKAIFNTDRAGWTESADVEAGRVVARIVLEPNAVAGIAGGNGKS